MPPLRSRTVAALATMLVAGAAASAFASGASVDRHNATAARRTIAPERAVRRLAARDALPAHALGRRRCPPGRAIHERLITRRKWVRDIAITEYYSTPERWFVGRLVRAPGLRGRHRVDWLYSARGVAMEGDGIGLDGRHYYIDALGSGAWVNARGHRTLPGRCAGHWSRGRPAWLQGGWRNAEGVVTFPLSGGGWSNGRGDHDRPYGGATFAPGSSMPLRPYRTLAVDPRLIPRGSRVYIPAYRAVNGGWFVAQDTGGAIIGRHVDVYRPPTATPTDGGRFLRAQRIYVVPPWSRSARRHGSGAPGIPRIRGDDAAAWAGAVAAIADARVDDAAGAVSVARAPALWRHVYGAARVVPAAGVPDPAGARAQSAHR